MGRNPGTLGPLLQTGKPCLGNPKLPHGKAPSARGPKPNRAGTQKLRQLLGNPPKTKKCWEHPMGGTQEKTTGEPMKGNPTEPGPGKTPQRDPVLDPPKLQEKTK